MRMRRYHVYAYRPAFPDADMKYGAVPYRDGDAADYALAVDSTPPTVCKTLNCSAPNKREAIATARAFWALQ